MQGARVWVVVSHEDHRQALRCESGGETRLREGVRETSSCRGRAVHGSLPFNRPNSSGATLVQGGAPLHTHAARVRSVSMLGCGSWCLTKTTDKPCGASPVKRG